MKLTLWIEKLVVRLWNRFASRRNRKASSRGLDLGIRLVDGSPTDTRITIPQHKRAEHLAIIGRTGQGKSRLVWHMSKSDIEEERGFSWFDQHGDATRFLLGTLAAREHVLGRDLSDRVIVIEPTDPDFSVGLNPFEHTTASNRFIRSAEFAQILKLRWGLESFGARTDELLRNSLYVLAEKGLTLLELAPLLTDASFRSQCLARLGNSEVRQYFELRYNRVSDAMQATMREPVLNKVSAFTGDPHIRHVIGQQHSTFSVVEAIDRGCWLIINLQKGRLGEQAPTLGSLFLTIFKNALFSRAGRDLFTLYCDEVHNLLNFGGDLETVLGESRKFSGSLVASTQYLDRISPELRAAILAVGTHIFFQLSSQDAQQVATALDGGKPLAELLKNLPRRHMVLKTGHERWEEVLVPEVREPKVDPTDLYNRSRARWARRRSDIEQEIAKRQSAIGHSSTEVLNEWE